jgi:hypothetical protein
MYVYHVSDDAEAILEQGFVDGDSFYSHRVTPVSRRFATLSLEDCEHQGHDVQQDRRLGSSARVRRPEGVTDQDRSRPSSVCGSSVTAVIPPRGLSPESEREARAVKAFQSLR